jgi:hypothetical protein
LPQDNLSLKERVYRSGLGLPRAPRLYKEEVLSPFNFSPFYVWQGCHYGLRLIPPAPRPLKHCINVHHATFSQGAPDLLKLFKSPAHGFAIHAPNDDLLGSCAHLEQIKPGPGSQTLKTFASHQADVCHESIEGFHP